MMNRHNLMMGASLCALSILRAPDDGAGTASPVDGSNGVGAAGNVKGSSAVAGVVKDAATAAAGDHRSDDSYDGLRRRVADLEVETDDLRTKLGALEAASTGNRGSADAGSIRRIEAVLGDIFGREFADYDAAQRAAPPLTVTGDKPV